ncbi:hypothetical protein VNPA152081_61980 [Pseudomonas aeruginosa]|nr:hypothetical protein VNPA141826_60730 [Pseudomonas aeruginosa]GLF81122.1 hypothetical protein VNPA152081_61980 [Pseudomonas aeruginosa]
MDQLHRKTLTGWALTRIEDNVLNLALYAMVPGTNQRITVANLQLTSLQARALAKLLLNTIDQSSMNNIPL